MGLIVFRTMSDSNKPESDFESELEETPSPRPITKKKKRLCCFNKEWLGMPDYKGWLRQGRDSNEARCIQCCSYFSVGTMGISSVKQHFDSQGHKKRRQASTSSHVLEKFLCKKDSKEEDLVTAAELTQVYHAVRHNLSYNSTDCQNRLNSKIYVDSKLAQKVSCGRTKSEAFVTEILGPFALEKVLSDLKDV